ncbi:MAG: DUF975 family protein [Bacteroidaceae bacterium]
MISSLSQLRAKGRADLSGRWMEAAMFTFVYMIVMGFASMLGSGLDNLFFGPRAFVVTSNTYLVKIFADSASGVFGLILTLLLLPVGWSYSVAFLGNRRAESDDPFGVGNLFVGYKDFRRVLVTMLINALMQILFYILFIIPGIWMSLRLALVPYILRDNPELSANRVLRLSAEMMNGYKWKLFLLALTFLGWAILCVFTLGIGYFWLAPYIDQTMANFYEEVKDDYFARKQDNTCVC